MKALLVSLMLLVACTSIVSGQTCYFCSNCPVPFTAYGVQTQVSSTGFCAKKSLYAYSGAPASRGPAEFGLCSASGCFYRYDTSIRATIYYCCCRTNFCNTGSSISQSRIAVLLGALILAAMHRYI